MSNYPYVEVNFVIDGVDFDMNKFNEDVKILSANLRTADEWPDSIKNNLEIPEALRPRNEWSICQKEEKCKVVANPIDKVVKILKKIEDKIAQYSEMYDMKKTLNIVVHCYNMEVPELVLPVEVVSFFGNLGVEIGFDIYIQ